MRLCKYQFKTRVERTGKILQKFGADIEKLVRTVYSKVTINLAQQLYVHHFIDSVKDHALQQVIRIEHYKELEVEAARNVNSHHVRDVKEETEGSINAE